MWLFPVIVTATLLPALTVLIFYLLTLTRRIDDPEIKARRRWRMMSRGNVIWAMGIIAGLIAIAEAPVPGFGPAARAAVSIFFVVIAFCPLAITLGIIDKRIRGIDYPLVGYMKLQYSLFFCRWTSFLVVIVIMYVFLNTVNRQVWISSAAIALAAGGAVLFVAITLFQMRLVGRVTGLLSPVNPDEEPARTVRELAARAEVSGVRVSVMETFGYPFYNAFAAPGKTVYITRPILSALTREEVSAIAAHEIGHLATMRQRTALMLTLLTAVVVGLWFLIPGLGWILSDIGSFIVEIAVTLSVLAIGIVALGAVSRRYETRADATATELMGGPRPVISALEKLYDLGMLPRRFDKKGSENASHPSLERRIAQLRGENLPKPKRKVRVLILITLCALILICLWLLSYLGEHPIGPDYPRSSYGDAVTTLEERLAKDPNDFEALKRLANEYYFLGEDGLALETIDRAMAVNRDPGLLLLKGVILEWVGDAGGALAAVEDALGAGAGPQALRWAAALAVELGDMKKAHDYLSTLRAVYPEDPYAEKMERYLSGDGGEYPFPDYSIVFQGTGR